MKTCSLVLAALFATSNAVQIKQSSPGVSPDCPEATSAEYKTNRLHPACFPNMAQRKSIESPDTPDPPTTFSYREGSSASASGLVQLSSPGVSPDCPEATSAEYKTNRLHPACFPNMAQRRSIESPDTPDPPTQFSYREGTSASAAGLSQFASGWNGDEDLGQDIIMKGDKYHYNQRQRLVEEQKDGGIPWRGYPSVGDPAKWKAYNDAYPAAEEPTTPPVTDLPLCRGYRSGQIAGVTCRIFVTSTPPGTHNTLAQLNGIHANAAHVTTAILPTCMGADTDVPETNCTNRAAPICNDDGTNGVPNISCTPKLPVCDGDNGHPGVDCKGAPLPACGVDFGGAAGRDCAPVHKRPQNWHFAQGPAEQTCDGERCASASAMAQRAEELGSEELVQYYLPTCSETTTVNCQPVCNEALTRGCTESRTPTPTPRDRFEGRKTF